MAERLILLHPESWGCLRRRYGVVKPRKMLALDGGYIRGLIYIAGLNAGKKINLEHRGLFAEKAGAP